MSRKDLTGPCGGKLNVWDINGLYVAGLPINVPKNLANLWHIEADSSDILICEYPKSGFHWVSEIVRILLSGQLALLPNPLQPIEFFTERTRKSLATIPSPRVFASHLPYENLPESFFRNKCRLIFLVRDPRAVAVSYFNHLKRMKQEFSNFEGNWNQFFQFFLKGLVPANAWYDYNQKWEQNLKKLQQEGQPVHIIQYEEISQRTKEEIKRLAQFLGKAYTEEFYENIVKLTDIRVMKKFKEADVRNPFRKSFENDIYPMFRKGKIDDWKNWFTVSQNELFIEDFNRRMIEKPLKLKSLL